MKKSVILIIFAVYILSICVVGFFGIKVRMYNETINVESIQITEVKLADGTNVEIKPDKSGKPSALYFCKNSGETVTFKIYYQINPANATDPTVSLLYDDSNPNVLVTKASGESAILVTFTNVTMPVSLNLTIASKVISTIRDSISLTVIYV
jgi:hypothetical protein